ncbi:MAG TPA: type II toxin-antitoxin system HicB family antitoxin [Phycisphaerae bacterium]|nr:type II toxin-antitoxin system HicB family antitoxin [Phycisphaerae bacterium]HUU23897.1 type II toxin-antitoxin system HicB family antitoxin [Phycisphaerae bacterium]
MRVQVNVESVGFGRFRARCPSLPGCTAEGQTRDEAWRKLAKAAEGYVASLNTVARLEFHEEGQAGIRA